MKYVFKIVENRKPFLKNWFIFYEDYDNEKNLDKMILCGFFYYCECYPT